MKKKLRLLALCLACAVALSGCAAMLEREYSSVEDHNEHPASDGPAGALRVESYQELVSAILYYVGRGQEQGTIHLYNYDETVEGDLERACLEVVQEDPLGAYAVDYIKYEVQHIVSYYEAQVQIIYRRTQAQIASVTSVTGSTAIRSELREAMESFRSERVLRIGYFDERGVDLQQLAREAYYAAPAGAFGMPEVTFAFYPEETTGRQRIVEVLLTYGEEPETLSARQGELLERVEALAAPLAGKSGEAVARAVFDAVRENAVYTDSPEGPSTPYAALLGGGADSEGFALLTKLLLDRVGVECTVTEGTRGGRTRFWVTADWGEGPLAVDASSPDGFGLDGETLADRSYVPGNTD